MFRVSRTAGESHFMAFEQDVCTRQGARIDACTRHTNTSISVRSSQRRWIGVARSMGASNVFPQLITTSKLDCPLAFTAQF